MPPREVNAAHPEAKAAQRLMVTTRSGWRAIAAAEPGGSGRIARSDRWCCSSEHFLRKVPRSQILDAARTSRYAGAAALRRELHERVAGSCICCPGVEPTSAQRVLDRMAESADPIGALCALPSPPRAGDDWKVFKPSAICVTPSGRS